MEKKEHKELEVILEPNAEGGYTALVPSIPGCVSKGATIDEVINNLKESIRLYLEGLMEQVLANAKKQGLS